MNRTTAAGTLVCVLALVTSCATDRGAGDGSKRLEPEIAAYRSGASEPRGLIERRMAELEVPGASVAVIRDSEIDWARGFGLADVEGRVAVDTGTLFQAASISKSVAAVAALRLVEERGLDLDSAVNELLVSWHVPDHDLGAGGPVTLRQLLSHTGGLSVHGFRGYAPGEPIPSLAQILDGAPPANSDAVRVTIAPGTRFSYSGGGYTVLQLVMTEVTGEDFDTLARRAVLDPLDMQASTYRQPLPEELLDRAAVGYRADGRAVEEKRHVYPEQAAAGLWTNPSDLARFLIEIQRSLDGSSNRVLSREMTERMLTEVAGRYGLGFALPDDPTPIFGHGGTNEGFHCLMLATRAGGEGIVVMTNGDNGPRLHAELVAAVRRVYGW